MRHSKSGALMLRRATARGPATSSPVPTSSKSWWSGRSREPEFPRDSWRGGPKAKWSPAGADAHNDQALLQQRCRLEFCMNVCCAGRHVAYPTVARVLVEVGATRKVNSIVSLADEDNPNLKEQRAELTKKVVVPASNVLSKLSLEAARSCRAVQSLSRCERLLSRRQRSTLMPTRLLMMAIQWTSRITK